MTSQIVIDKFYDPSICDVMNCHNKAVKYVVLPSGAVHLCGKHAAQHSVQPTGADAPESQSNSADRTSG